MRHSIRLAGLPQRPWSLARCFLFTSVLLWSSFRSILSRRVFSVEHWSHRRICTCAFQEVYVALGCSRLQWVLLGASSAHTWALKGCAWSTLWRMRQLALYSWQNQSCHPHFQPCQLSSGWKVRCIPRACLWQIPRCLSLIWSVLSRRPSSSSCNSVAFRRRILHVSLPSSQTCGSGQVSWLFAPHRCWSLPLS